MSLNETSLNPNLELKVTVKKTLPDLQFDDYILIEKATSIMGELTKYRQKGFSANAKRARKMAAEMMSILKKMRLEVQNSERRLGRVTYQLKEKDIQS